MSDATNNARLVADLQNATLAITMFGLDAVNAGHVTFRNGPRYRGFQIGMANYSPAAQFDWEFTHEDYDGAPDGGDNRHGRGASLADCMAQIDDMLEDGQ